VGIGVSLSASGCEVNQNGYYTYRGEYIYFSKVMPIIKTKMPSTRTALFVNPEGKGFSS